MASTTGPQVRRRRQSARLVDGGRRKAFDEPPPSSARSTSPTAAAGHEINGRLTMGENIGDLSGIAIAYRAYRLSLGGKPAPVIDGFTGDQRFFIGYAQSGGPSRVTRRWNSCSPTRTRRTVRAFVPLSNIDAFYTAFNVKPGDKLYLPPEIA